MQRIQIVEVAPRDGLQNEAALVPTAAKVAFVEALARSGVREIEVTGFVSPKWVPQLADAEDVFAALRREPGVVYSALVPNRRGLERALAARVDKIAVLAAASETFNTKNLNAGVAAALATCREVVRGSPVPARGYVSTAFHCPFEGPVAPAAVAAVVEELLAMGCVEIAVGDTIGRATPDEVHRLLDVLLPRFPAAQFAMHMHDTGGLAVANCKAAASRGIVRFDACAGGLGGCPYAPGDHGNVATEALAEAFAGRVAVDVQRVRAALELVGMRSRHAS